MQCICSEVSIVAHIMQLAFVGLKRPINILSWLSQLHLFRGIMQCIRSEVSIVAHIMQLYSVFMVEMTLTFDSIETSEQMQLS